MSHSNEIAVKMYENNKHQGLPPAFPKHVIEKAAKEHNFLNFELKITEGSSKGENFFGELYKVKITGKTTENDNVTKYWILKKAPDNASFRKDVPLHRYYCREVSAYNTILPALYETQKDLLQRDQFHFVKCHVASDEEYNELLLMDDLNKEDFIIYDRLLGMDYEHTTMGIRNLARFHATSFVLRRKNPSKFRSICEGACQKMDYGDNFDKFINQNRKQILRLIVDTESHSKLSVYLQDMEEKLEMFLDPNFVEPYNVLCHGDCWTSNILFKYKNGKPIDVKMIDWQVIRLASPITDVAYMLFTSTDETLRTLHLYDILNIYYETLKNNVNQMGCDINDCYPKNVFDDHIRVILPFGLLISIALCPIILSDRDQTADLAKSNTDFNENADHETKFSKTPTERLIGVVNTFIKYQLI